MRSANRRADALIFDCDGVLADTERDGHRLAFNQAFAALGLDDEWSAERYGELLRTAGGKERMIRHFNETRWPVPAAERDSLIRKLHETKTRIFMDLVRAGRLPPRPGVARLVDEARAAGLKLAVCSTSNEHAVQAIVDLILGARASDVRVFAGDIVARKKPDPAIYRLASAEIGVEPARCVVVEDSNNGLLAALGAGMRCIVTKSSYTANEDFSGAEKVVPDLGDREPFNVTLADIA